MYKLTPLTQKQVQQRLLIIWSEIEKVFHDAGVRYFLSFGSLLGAVRHQGFIPWDDDLDVHIHQDDYQMALSALDKNLPDGLQLVTASVDMSWDIDFRVVDLKTRLNSEESLDSATGLCIDFFAVERCHPNMGYWHALYKKLKHQQERNQVRASLVTKSLLYGLRLLLVVRGCFSKKAHWFVNDKLQPTTFTDEELWPLESRLFENRPCFVPAQPERFLQAWYGDDFMTPLPESQRKGHFSKCFYMEPSNP